MNERYPLSLSGDTFNGLKADFDIMLRQLLTEMEKHEAEDGSITIKVGVKLEKDQARDFQANGYDAMRDIVKPSFKHDISTVMQIKDKKTGSVGGSMELAWDHELCQYVMRPIDNGQTSLFNKDGGKGSVVDVDFRELDAYEYPALPERMDGDPEVPPVAEAAVGTHLSAEMTPFDWLRQFAGVKMRVLEAMGHYTVRTTDNKVILSSGTNPASQFYCPDSKLAPPLSSLAGSSKSKIWMSKGYLLEKAQDFFISSAEVPAEVPLEIPSDKIYVRVWRNFRPVLSPAKSTSWDAFRAVLRAVCFGGIDIFRLS